MIDLFLAMAVLCFLTAIIIYYSGKSIQALKELKDVYKDYKKSEKEVLNFLKENK